ncbi:hypothetical protein [Pelagicoccus sp. SDUM812003]|uniref:hypothetical protein n=1 Tax=Pelagicoccus sp. SDUM812003 TaxID=3041267 RepID=UPI00280E13C5|nr:hypothetical protein [Pelagicoccus sp. SDUM812003]MDQ8205417.1 hypothetical protein [Pelagicoccus sp. SDUM812003]
MGNYEHDSDPNSDWDDSCESDWTEFNWEHYLQREDKEIAKYQSLYNKLIRSPNRLDEVALYMGWQQRAPEIEDEETVDQEDVAYEADQQPYTIHKHPLFVSSKALHGWLLEQWSRHIALAGEQLPAQHALSLQTALMESDQYGLLAVTALDLNDFALAIAYFKRGMVSINKAFALLAKFESLEIEPLNRYVSNARIRLFDIREIWLRVSSDCRTTIARGSDED